MENRSTDQKDGDLNAVAPQATGQSMENTLSHILFELNKPKVIG